MKRTALIAGDAPNDLHDAIISAIPLGRLGTIDDVARAMIFMARDDAVHQVEVARFPDRRQTLQDTDFTNSF